MSKKLKIEKIEKLKVQKSKIFKIGFWSKKLIYRTSETKIHRFAQFLDPKLKIIIFDFLDIGFWSEIFKKIVGLFCGAWPHKKPTLKIPNAPYNHSSYLEYWSLPFYEKNRFPIYLEGH